MGSEAICRTARNQPACRVGGSSRPALGSPSVHACRPVRRAAPAPSGPEKKLDRSVDKSVLGTYIKHMVEQFAHLDAVFHCSCGSDAAGHAWPTRGTELTIGELATPFSMSSRVHRNMWGAGERRIGGTDDPRSHPSVPSRGGAACGADAWYGVTSVLERKARHAGDLCFAEDEAKAKR